MGNIINTIAKTITCFLKYSVNMEAIMSTKRVLGDLEYGKKIINWYINKRL